PFGCRQCFVDLHQCAHQTLQSLIRIPGSRHCDNIGARSHFHLEVISFQQEPVQLSSCKLFPTSIRSLEQSSLRRNNQLRSVISLCLQKSQILQTPQFLSRPLQRFRIRCPNVIPSADSPYALIHPCHQYIGGTACLQQMQILPDPAPVRQSPVYVQKRCLRKRGKRLVQAVNDHVCSRLI